VTDWRKTLLDSFLGIDVIAYRDWVPLQKNCWMPNPEQVPPELRREWAYICAYPPHADHHMTSVRCAIIKRYLSFRIELGSRFNLGAAFLFSGGMLWMKASANDRLMFLYSNGGRGSSADQQLMKCAHKKETECCPCSRIRQRWIAPSAI
jgi:hypothetical protein